MFRPRRRHRAPLPLDWSDIPALVAANAGEPLGAFLQHAALMPDACDPGDGDFVIELFTDSSIIADTKKSAQVDRVLTTVIDAYVCEERFPRRERITLYQAVLDVWLSSRALSTDPIDGQLLLTMADALLRLDGRLEQLAATAITRWWEARAVRARLAWLGEALELLSEQSIARDCESARQRDPLLRNSPLLNQLVRCGTPRRSEPRPPCRFTVIEPRRL